MAMTLHEELRGAGVDGEVARSSKRCGRSLAALVRALGACLSGLGTARVRDEEAVDRARHCRAGQLAGQREREGCTCCATPW